MYVSGDFPGLCGIPVLANYLCCGLIRVRPRHATPIAYPKKLDRTRTGLTGTLSLRGFSCTNSTNQAVPRRAVWWTSGGQSRMSTRIPLKALLPTLCNGCSHSRCVPPYTLLMLSEFSTLQVMRQLAPTNRRVLPQTSKWRVDTWSVQSFR